VIESAERKKIRFGYVAYRPITLIEKLLGRAFVSRDDYVAARVVVQPDERHFPIVAAHEIAHLLNIRYVYMDRFDKIPIYRLREEILAWRTAKSFVKPSIWAKHRGDDMAKAGLHYLMIESGFPEERAERILAKLRIIPLLRRGMWKRALHKTGKKKKGGPR